MIAIFTPFRWFVAALIRAVVCLQVKQCPPAGWTRDIVCFEYSGSGSLQNIVGQTKRLAWRCFSLDQDCVANTITQQRSEVARRLEKRFQEVAVRAGRRKKRVLQQESDDGHPKLGRKQTVSFDHRQIDFVLNRDKSGFAGGIELGDCCGIGRIDRRQICGFQDAFRLEIAHFLELMNNVVERLLPYDHPDGFLAANSDPVHLDLSRGPPFVGKWVKRKSHVPTGLYRAWSGARWLYSATSA